MPLSGESRFDWGSPLGFWSTLVSSLVLGQTGGDLRGHSLKSVGPLVGTGRTSELYAYGVDSVLKVLRPGMPDGWAETEHRIALAVYETGAPIPQPRNLLRYQRRPAIEYRWVEAPTLREAIVAGRVAPAAGAQLLAEVHQRLLGIEMHGSLPDGLAPLGDRMRQKLAVLDELSTEDRCLAHLLIDELVAGTHLLHGDLHPGNVLLADEPIVIDWFDGAVGSAAADIARSMLLLHPDLLRGPNRGERGTFAHLVGMTPQSVLAVQTDYRKAMGWGDISTHDEVRLNGLVALCRMAEAVEAEHDFLASLWAECVQRHRMAEDSGR